MNTLKLLLALTFVVSTVPSAFAQLSVYGTVTVRRMTDIPFTQGTTTSTNGSFDPVGGTVGISYDFRTVGPVRLGVDARGILTNSSQGAYTSYNAAGGHLDSGLGGIKATFHTRFIPLRPYVEGMAGVARTNFGTGYNNGLSNAGVTNQTGVQLTSHLEYDAFAGLDISIIPLVDFRLVEVGYGAVEGNSHTYPVGSISTGVVFHLPFGLGK